MQRAPQHAIAVHQLAGLLAGTAQAETSQRLAELSRQLNELRQLIVVGKRQGDNADAEVIEQVAALLETLSRDWEAFVWSQLALGRNSTVATT